MNGALRAWVARRTSEIVAALIDDAPALGIRVAHGPGGTTILDCGVSAPGSWEAGRRVSILAHGGMMDAHLGVTELCGVVLPEFVGDSWSPADSAYGLQVSLPLSEVDPAVRISGPIRERLGGAGTRPLWGGTGANPWGTAIVEAAALPGPDIVEAIARRAELSPSALTLVVVPSTSLAGGTQVAGRLNESVLFTWCDSLGLPADRVLGIVGSVPIAPVAADARPAVTQDDMIHYAGRATVLVNLPPTANLERIAENLTFGSTKACGCLFSTLLAEAGGVFEAIPGIRDLNKIACITLVDRSTGRVAMAGTADERILVEGLERGTL
ncbi:MAG: methenyltetrahydromethanopterin cyclohydrolase [Candidatus Bipolaricaulis sp.]|nr:methenyltetrahydromethanopterin cyclohydrolase [Candidatus Bipolaricaulis sp.]MDD5220957.1 methenyltetrahydromethanopterin cyclohydrolase [Candidatus Bipolaricaulis sp.]